MNANIPHFFAICNGVDKENNYYDCVVHAIRSRAGKVLTFHCHLDNGAHYSLLPINKLTHKPVTKKFELKDLQPWDCFSDEAEVIKFDYFEFRKAYVMSLKIWGEYLFTVDWLNNTYSDYTLEFKQGHFLKLDNGQYGLFPNNFLLFKDKTWTGDIDIDNVPRLHRQDPGDYPAVETL